MSATGTPKASQAAITAVQEALGCKPGKHWHVVQWVTYGGNAESVEVQWTERGCPVAVAAADAAAPHNAAQALREAAREPMDDGLYIGDLYRTHLNRLADRIEAGP